MSNEQEESGLFEELFSNPQAQNETIEKAQDTSSLPKIDLKDYENLKATVEKQNQELLSFRKIGSKIDKLHSALSDEEPDPDELEARRLTEEYDADPGRAVLKLQKNLESKFNEERNKEKKSTEFRFLKREIAQDYDINFDDPKVAKAIVNELNTMDKSYKDKDMKGAILRAMKLSGNDKKREAPFFADSSYSIDMQRKLEKTEGNKIVEDMKAYKAQTGQGKVLSHIFGK